MSLKTTSLFILSLVLLYSCGGASQNTTSNETQSTATESTLPKVDINAKSDSKGIGRFTSVNLAPVNSVAAEKGEVLFSTQCASCHKSTAERLIGPGLKGVTEKRTPEWILNMITNPEENLKKDPLGKALLEEYKAVMPYMGTTDEDAKSILDFLRQNDAK